MKFPENASFLSPKQVNWCGIAPYLPSTHKSDPGRPPEQRKRVKICLLEARWNNPRHPPAGVAGRPILSAFEFEQKLAVKIRLSSNIGYMGYF